MSKYLIIGDSHLKPSNLEKVMPLFDAIKTFAYKNRLRMIFLGDLYDTNGIIHASVHEYWFNYFSKKEDFINKPIVIVGNHDMKNQVARASDTETPLRTLPNIELVDRPCIEDNMAFIPYAHDKEMFTEYLNEINNIPIRTDYLFCHQEFKGFHYENGIPTNEQSSEVPSQFKLVIAGHIHKRQQSGNLVYLGAPYHQKKSDVGNPRQLGVFDNETGSLEFISDLEHLAPKIEPQEEKEQVYKNNIKPTKHLSLDDLLVDIIEKRYEDREYGRKILDITRNYLRTPS